MRSSGVRNLVHQCQGMPDGEDGIPVAMNDEGRHLDRAQPVPERSADVHRKVVDLARGDIDGTVDLTTHQIAHGRFIEVTGTTRVQTQQINDGVDHGRPIGPVGSLSATDVRQELLGHRG